MYAQSQVAELRTLLDRLHQRDIAMRSAEVSSSNAARAISGNCASSESLVHGRYGFFSGSEAGGVAGPASDPRHSTTFPAHCDTMEVPPPWSIQLEHQQQPSAQRQASWLDSDLTRYSGSDSARGCNFDNQAATDSAVNAGIDGTELCESVELAAAGAAADAGADSEVDVYADQEPLWMGSPPLDGDLSS